MPRTRGPTITKAGVQAVAATPETGKAHSASEGDLAANEGQSDGFRTSLGSELVAGALGVGADGLRRQAKPLRDRGAVLPVREQAQDLTFAVGQRLRVR